MTATMDQIRQRLAEIQASVTGIKRAYVRAPQALADSDLPAFCTFAGAATLTALSDGLAEETRTWLMRLYVTPILSGIDGEAEKVVEEFLIQVRNVFLKHPQLGKGVKDAVLPFVEKTVWLGDNGIQILPYAGQNYLGIEFRLNIVTIASVTIANFE